MGRLQIMRQIPAVMKAYLRLGGGVGDGVFVDHAFNTTDVCMVVDMENLNGARAALYDPGTAR